MFDLDDMYNAQNDRIWAVNREEADKRGGVQQKRKFAQKVMVLGRSMLEGIDTIDHSGRGNNGSSTVHR